MRVRAIVAKKDAQVRGVCARTALLGLDLFQLSYSPPHNNTSCPVVVQIAHLQDQVARAQYELDAVRRSLAALGE